MIVGRSYHWLAVFLVIFEGWCVMPGPAPQKSARRRNARPDWLFLPREGRTGVTPEWPVSLDQPEGWDIKWHELWGRPQAVAWELLGMEAEVARYVWVWCYATLEPVAASLLAECRQLEDRLGLSPMALKRLQWEIVDEVPDAGRERARALSSVMDYA